MHRIQVCDRCGSSDVLQQISYMVNPNTYEGDVSDSDSLWEDYAICNFCNRECDLTTKVVHIVEPDPED